jgi:hypothetical protein
MRRIVVLAIVMTASLAASLSAQAAVRLPNSCKLVSTATIASLTGAINVTAVTASSDAVSNECNYSFGYPAGVTPTVTTGISIGVGVQSATTWWPYYQRQAAKHVGGYSFAAELGLGHNAVQTASGISFAHRGLVYSVSGGNQQIQLALARRLLKR